MNLYVAFKVSRIRHPDELLGVFSSPEKIKQAYPITNSNDWIIGYGIVTLDNAFPIELEQWSDTDWIWLE
jgi:hypothetical protein